MHPVDKKLQVLPSFLLIFFVLLCFLAYQLLLDNTILKTSFLKPIPSIIPQKVEKSNLAFKEERQIISLSKLKSDPAIQIKLDSINNYIFYSGLEHLGNFVTAINQCGSKQARIAYFGDSSIEGDLMSMTLRSFFQKLYGGKGVGFVPITSLTSGFRSSISHSFSSNWTYGSIVQNYGSAYPYGISGEVFYIKNDSILAGKAQTASVKYGLQSSTNVQAILFYGKQDTSTTLPSNSVMVGASSVLLSDSNVINTKVIGNQANAYSLNFTFNRPQPIYGVSFASPTGVVVDNFGLRSNSGGTLSKISNNNFLAFNKHLDYDLIILQYGLNVLGDNPDDDYLWYQTQMSNVIQKLKTVFPNASFLLVSIGDKSEKNAQGILETQVNVEKLVSLQKDLARDNNLAFFNMYEAMGGKNSMVEWVDTHGWANKDYTHFNHKGAAIMGDSISHFLNKAYLNQFICEEK